MSQQGKSKGTKSVVQVTLKQDVKLRETENAWKPARAMESNDSTEAADNEVSIIGYRENLFYF